MGNQQEKKQQEPEYLTSATGIPTLNYSVYYMKPSEKIITALILFALGFVVGYLFYGGIGKDEFGNPTTLTKVLNIIIPSIIGLVAAKLFLPLRVKTKIQKRKQALARQFRDMLDGLTTALSAGKNVTDSFYSVYDDLKIQYDEGAYILKELEVIIAGIQNNIAIEDVLMDFGKRSDIEDIVNFASVFQTCYREGGNIKDVIKNTHTILSDKMEISEEIETLVTSNKTEQNIMLVMPIVLIGIMKFGSPDFAANFVTPTGIISTTISIVVFAIAYFIGRAVLSIKI